VVNALNQVEVSTHYKARVRDDLKCGNKERNNTKNE
jgi:hypothetical protein